jgi:hypothetical protein
MLSTFFLNIVKEFRPEPEYFRVGFYGLSLPHFVRKVVDRSLYEIRTVYYTQYFIYIYIPSTSQFYSFSMTRDTVPNFCFFSPNSKF